MTHVHEPINTYPHSSDSMFDIESSTDTGLFTDSSVTQNMAVEMSPHVSHLDTESMRPCGRVSQLGVYLEWLYRDVFLSGDMSKTKAALCVFKGWNTRPINMLLIAGDIVLRGVSQVYLCDHPLSGLLICIGVGLTSPALILHGLLGTVVSTITATLMCKLPYHKIHNGLLGYDGALVGCAVWIFLAGSSSFLGGWLVLVTILLSAVAGILHMTCANTLGMAKLPPFTCAFNLAVFFFFIAVARGNTTASSFRRTYSEYPDDFTEMSFFYVVDAVFKGVGQFMFADTTVGGVLVVAGIAMQSRRDAVCAMLGAVVGAFTARYVLHLPHEDYSSIRNGLYGYNAAGVCVVLGGGRFYKPTRAAYIIGAVGAMICVFIQVAYQSAFVVNAIKLPVLTFPFITSSWVFMMTQSGWLIVRTDANEDAETMAPPRRNFKSFMADIYRKRLVRQRATNNLYRGEKKSSPFRNRVNVVAVKSCSSNGDVNSECSNSLEYDERDLRR